MMVQNHPIKTENTLSFNDVTFGNGIFVAVGNDEIIYKSTDGDDLDKSLSLIIFF